MLPQMIGTQMAWLSKLPAGQEEEDRSDESDFEEEDLLGLNENPAGSASVVMNPKGKPAPASSRSSPGSPDSSSKEGATVSLWCHLAN